MSRDLSSASRPVNTLCPAYHHAAMPGHEISPQVRAAGEIADIALVLRDRAREHGLEYLVHLLDLTVAEAMDRGRDVGIGKIKSTLIGRHRRWAGVQP